MTKIQPKMDGAEKAVSAQNPSETDGLLKSSGITGSMTMLSRVLGLVRDVVIARVFGTTDASDAFFLANKIPNFMRRLFAEGAFNQAFVPVLAEYRSQRAHGAKVARHHRTLRRRRVRARTAGASRAALGGSRFRVYAAADG